MTWKEFYKNRLNDNYFSHVKNQYRKFIDEVENTFNTNDIVMEVGCGIGSITKALIERKKAKYFLSDVNEEMLKLTEKNVCRKGMNYNILDKLPFHVDVIHSHGVLEHFEPEEVKKIINNQRAVCRKLVHYVPSNKYDYKSFGDEMLLSKEEWKKIICPYEIKEFNNGYLTSHETSLMLWMV